MNPALDLKFFDPFADPRVTTNRLPHWEQDGCTYFVTFRTADSIPAELAGALAEELRGWLQHHPKPWSAAAEREYWSRFGSRTERWLDEGNGACLLRLPELAAIVGGALRFHEGKLCAHASWVVMPNHVHAVFSLIEGATLAKLLHSWKSFTANQINRLTGASGAFWQRDYFDRLIRSPEHFWACVRYIRQNPTGLRPGEYLHWEAPSVAEVLDAP
ncbi:MAG: hypothetical protein DVB27_01595 [Verrucomicrobia bacterium]|nr:MAG: hypothetical protein DVB27_01595 [Verrucomicrobiota bacterium]